MGRAAAIACLILAAYCVIAAATAFYAQPLRLPRPPARVTGPGDFWSVVVPLAGLALVIGGAIGTAARWSRLPGRIDLPSAWPRRALRPRPATSRLAGDSPVTG